MLLQLTQEIRIIKVGEEKPINSRISKSLLWTQKCYNKGSEQQLPALPARKGGTDTHGGCPGSPRAPGHLCLITAPSRAPPGPTMEGWAANRKTWPLVPRSTPGSEGHKQGLQVSAEPACPSFRIHCNISHASLLPRCEPLGGFLQPGLHIPAFLSFFLTPSKFITCVW